MPAISDEIDLGQLGLKPGGGTRFDIAVRIGEFVFGEQRYSLADDPAIAQLDVSRTSSGYVARIRFEPEIEGPCMRCSDDFGLRLEIDHSEVHEPYLDEELASEYVTDNKLDISALTRDVIVLALPTSISGPIDAEGSCGACDRSVADLAALGIAGVVDPVESQAEPAPDPRWAKLRELEL
ncbi:MAG: YceD family protein [Solirubrobacterales bacterium]